MRVSAPVTDYGTSSLQSDETLSARAAAASKRRAAAAWGLLALAVCGVVGMQLSGPSEPPSIASGTTSANAAGALSSMMTGTITTRDKAAAAATATAATAPSDDIFCVQSSYVDGETKMVEPIDGLKWTPQASASASKISVDAGKQYQEIFGFGGAFTEASALQFEKLSPAKQEEVLTLYFDKEKGNAYEFGRVPMGSCDFSVASYSFDDVTNDTSLSYFDMGVTHDTKVLIPFIQRALEKNPGLKMFLAPWSPPGWMKRASAEYIPSMLGSADPVGLGDDFRASWALYFSKFISAYKQQGIDFWGLTPQNEPEFAAPWEACRASAGSQADFVGRFLGPVMKRDHPEVKIMVFDHNRGSVYQWASEIFNHPTASQYVDGIAFHWYDYARFMDGVAFHERLNDTHYVDPKRFMLATESCNCPGVATKDDAWFRGQRYAHDMITDFNNWVSGWVDWNLILDHTGGPNHLNNTCDAPIIIDETEENYFIQPMYYFIQHFSKYVTPGSRRVHTDVQVKYKQPGDPQLLTQYPSGLYSCDGSSRQNLRRSEEDKLEVNGTIYCLYMREVPWQGNQVELIPCPGTNQTWTFEESGQIHIDDNCLALNHGSTDYGARIMVEKCVAEEAEAQHQRWRFEGGEMKPKTADKCVTAGYPFAQAAAFVTPENKKVLVVLNENSEPAEFDIDVGGRSVSASVPRGGIRTFVWE